MPVRSLPRRLYAFTLLLVCLATGCSARVDEKTIELSYEEHSGFCEGCDAFQLTFRYGGNAEFRGLGGCAIPGRHYFRTPATNWQALRSMFRSLNFFSIPRQGPMVYDATAITLTYRDSRRIHEVIDLLHDNAPLRRLEETMRKAGHIEPWITPTPELYRKALAETLGREHAERGRWSECIDVRRAQ
jgi:hypothetical protein